MSHWFRPDVVALAGLILLAWVAAHILAVSPERAVALYRRHVGEGRHERLFLSSLAFFGAFVIVRAITLMIHFDLAPFGNVTARGVHIHHLVWGILLLLLVGYLWLLDIGTGVAAAAGCS